VEPNAPSHGTSNCRSAMTAPAVTWAFLSQQGMQTQRAAGQAAPCEGPDCLPENSLVYVESRSDPQALGSVPVGEKVLCHDSLTNSTCYVSVTSVEILDEADAIGDGWVRLRLSDGTALTMTGDHPLRVRDSDQLDAVKLAGEVQPLGDSILSLRLMQQEIVAVERGIEPPPISLGDGAHGPPRRVSLSVEQGTRFSILVSPAGCKDSFSKLTAVGSADASVGSWCRRHAGLEFGTRPPPLRRTVSDSDLGSREAALAGVALEIDATLGKINCCGSSWPGWPPDRTTH